MTRHKEILFLIIVLLLSTMLLTACEDEEIASGMYAGYCWDSWAGEHYYCGD